MRIDEAPAFVLHARPWRETSLLVEVLSAQHGRIGGPQPLPLLGHRRVQGPRRRGDRIRRVAVPVQQRPEDRQVHLAHALPSPALPRHLQGEPLGRGQNPQRQGRLHQRADGEAHVSHPRVG